MKDLEIIKNTALDIAGLPKGVVADIAKFDSHYAVVVASKALVDGHAFCLPGSMALIDSKHNQFNIFGIETPELKVLVIMDKTIDLSIGITKEDLNFFEDLEKFEIVCNLRNLELDIDEIFRPIGSLINSLVVSENASTVEFQSAVNGKSIFVKKGSNRHKFIEGKADFFSDPFDFLASREVTVRMDMIEHYSAAKDSNPYLYMFEKLNYNTLGTCLTIFANADMKMIAKKALELREKYVCKITEDNYWYNFEEPTSIISKFEDIDWDLVEQVVSKNKNKEESFQDIAEAISVEAHSGGWGEYTVHVFFMFYLLLEQDKVDFIKSSFNL